jgi:hypothetical protein
VLVIVEEEGAVVGGPIGENADDNDRAEKQRNEQGRTPFEGPD